MQWHGASSALKLARFGFLSGAVMMLPSCGSGALRDNGGAGAAGTGGFIDAQASSDGSTDDVQPSGSAGVDGSPGVGGSGGESADAGEEDAKIAEASADDAQPMSRYRAIGIATGETHTCALLDNHRVKCWGANGHGQLGYGDAQMRGNSPADMGNALPFVDLGTGRTATKIAAGRYDTCAILDDGSLKCWGWSGLNGHFPDDIGDAPNETGDNLRPLNFGGRRVLDVAIGNEVACAAAEDETVWCWRASSDSPQLQAGLPSKAVKSLTASGQGVVALYSDGTVSPNLPSSPGGVSIFAAGQTFLALSGANLAATCGLSDSTTVVCSAPIGPTLPLALPSSATALGMQWAGYLCVVFSDGSVQCPGEPCSGAYWCDAQGRIATGGGATAISYGGSRFSCVVLADGNVKCWGGDPSAAPPPWLGAGISYDSNNGEINHGEWNAVDLGTRP
jgi:hypothetical protein